VCAPCSRLLLKPLVSLPHLSLSHLSLSLLTLSLRLLTSPLSVPPPMSPLLPLLLGLHEDDDVSTIRDDVTEDADVDADVAERGDSQAAPWGGGDATPGLPSSPLTSGLTSAP